MLEVQSRRYSLAASVNRHDLQQTILQSKILSERDGKHLTISEHLEEVMS